MVVELSCGSSSTGSVAVGRVHQFTVRQGCATSGDDGAMVFQHKAVIPAAHDRVCIYKVIPPKIIARRMVCCEGHLYHIYILKGRICSQ